MAATQKSLMQQREETIKEFQQAWNFLPHDADWKTSVQCVRLQDQLGMLRDMIKINRARSLYYKKMFKHNQRIKG